MVTRKKTTMRTMTTTAMFDDYDHVVVSWRHLAFFVIEATAASCHSFYWLLMVMVPLND